MMGQLKYKNSYLIFNTINLGNNLRNIKDINSIEDLKTRNNERIIRLAYKNILGREVDSNGLKVHLLNLRKSMSIEEFLLMLKKSPEVKLKYNYLKKNIEKRHIRQETNKPTDEMLRHLGSKAKYFYFSLKKESQNLSVRSN